jgi:putative glutamine amidotransferase
MFRSRFGPILENAVAIPPLIGLTPTPVMVSQMHGEFREFQLNEAYPSAVIAAGGLPVTLPSMADPAACLDRIDGLLLTGGGDIAPHRYAGRCALDDRNYGVDDERDTFELSLFRLALERGVPVFAICRGLQVMNVALGGTLIHHIEADPADRPGGVHRQQEAGIAPDADWHTIDLADHPFASLFADGASLMVNSFHHQGIRDLAPGLTAIGIAPDGLVEAVVVEGAPFALGVQWHPELMFRRDPSHLRGFRAFISAAGEFAQRSQNRPLVSV